MTAPVRDSQRSKVYAWESHCSVHLRHVIGDVARQTTMYAPEFSTLAECQAFLTPIWTKEHLRYGAPKTPPKVALKHKQGLLQ